MSEQKKLPEIFWSQQFGNRYLVNICPQMLTGTFKVLREIKLPPFHCSQSKERCFVIYDRDYVIDKLMHTVIEPLEGVSYHDIQAVLSEAYKKHKKERQLQQS